MGIERENRRPLSWPPILFITTTTLIAAAWPVYAYFYGVTVAEIVLAVVYFVVAGMSITVGYHRMISHRAFRARRWLQAAFLICGSAAWQGSALAWAADHLRHHSYTDTRRDPYNIKQGFLYAHVGWLFRRVNEPSPRPAYLTSDPLIMWQDRHYLALAVTTSFIVPYAIAGLGGLLLAGVVRVVVGHHCTWFVNSWAHMGRRRPYDPRVSAADNWFLSLFTFGEGFHNYHHAFPSDYRNGIAPLAWDPSKWMIWTLSKLGVTYDLRRVRGASRWRRRVDSLLECDWDAGEKFARLRKTRAALERQIERSRVRLARLAERRLGMEQAATATVDELRRRVVRAMHERTQAITAASRARVERARELLDNLEAYQSLLERLRSYEAELAPCLA